MKIKEQFLVAYLNAFFEAKDVLRESEYKKFAELAERDEDKQYASNTKTG